MSIFDQISSYVSSKTPEVISPAKQKIGQSMLPVGQTKLPIESGASVFKKIGGFIKDVLQGTARSGASVGLSLTGTPELKAEDGTVAGKVQKFIFGQEPIESLQTRIAKFPERAKEFGIPESISNPLSVPIILGLTALDFTGAGGEKNVLKTLAKTTEDGAIKSILKKLNVADDLIDSYSPLLKEAKTEKEVSGILDRISEIQKTTKTSKDPLIQEAKKYATSDEFVKAKPTYYRGTTAPQVGDIKPADTYGLAYGKGIYLASDSRFAKDYGPNVKEYFVDWKNPLEMNRPATPDLIAQVKKDFPEFIEQKGMIGEDLYGELPLNQNEANVYLQKLGYDGLKDASSGYTSQSVVFDSSSLKTKSQLINIWKEANKVEPEIKTIGKIAEETMGTDPFKSLRKERGFVHTVKQELPEIKVSGQYIPRDTDRLAIKARTLIQEDINAAERMAEKGTDDSAIATASELLKHYNSEAQKTTDGAVKNALYDKAAVLAHDTAVKLTNQGRAIQAASILGRLTPEGQLRFAAREIEKYNTKIEKSAGGLLGLKKKVPELTGEQAQRILTESKRIQEMPDSIEKAMAFKKFSDELSDLIPSSTGKKIISLWKAGLLTGLKTSGVNILSNLFHGGTEIIKDIPAAAVDSVASLFSGKRTLGLTVKGTGGGIRNGFAKGWRYLKTGFDERDVASKLDFKRVNFGKSKFAKVLQTYEESIFRVLGAEDQPFYYGAKARSIQSQAIAEAKNKGLKGEEAKKFIHNLVENPTDDILKNAVNDAEISVFQNRTLLGEAAKQIQRTQVGEFVVPFGRTPSAVAMQIVNYSPVGLAKTIIENIGKGKFNQRAFSQGMGRGLTGTAVLGIGMALYDKNLISLDYPTTEKERKQWELEGRKENSFYDPVQKKWRSISVFGPAGNVLLVGGQYKRALDKTGSPVAALSEAAGGAGKSLTEQTFLRGLSGFVDAIQDPERYGKAFLESTAGSGVPTIVSDVARATDTKERKATGIMNRIKSRIPGARQTLEPKVNVLGEEMERTGNAIETMLDPTRPTKELSSPVISELRRLFDAGFVSTPSDITPKNGYPSLTPEQNTQLLKNIGELLNVKLEKLITKDEYKKLSDEEKQKLIEGFTSKAQNYARAGMVRTLVDGLSGEDLKTKLSELKKDKLLTKSVFNLLNQ